MIIISYYIICLSIITVNNNEKKDEEFLSFLQFSIGLFLSGVSVLTPNPGRLWDVTDLSDLFIHQYGHHIFHPLYPASQYIILRIIFFSYKRLLPQIICAIPTVSVAGIWYITYRQASKK